MSSEDSVLAFLRKGQGSQDHLLICCNFTPVSRTNYRVGVPSQQWYQEVMNTDATCYGGSGVGNHPGRQAGPVAAQSRPFSISVNLPPLGMVVFKPQRASNR